jgi:hypothetical protein
MSPAEARALQPNGTCYLPARSACGAVSGSRRSAAPGVDPDLPVTRIRYGALQPPL